VNLPSSCEGCPFYQYADDPENGFVPDLVVPGSKVYFIAQNPGRDEMLGRKLVRRHFYGGHDYSDEFTEVTPQPLIGATGKQFDSKFLPLSGLKRDEISLGNAIRCRPGKAMMKAGVKGITKADDLPSITATMKLERSDSKSPILNAIKHCREVHFNPPRSIQYVVTMGRHAMFAMTGLSKDTDEYNNKQSVLENWRGYALDVDFHSGRIATVDSSHYHPLLSGSIVFFTMHIAALNYGNNKRFTHATLQDFHKLKLLMNGDWPKTMPKWSTEIPDVWPKYAAFDTEYNPKTNELYRWSMCSSDEDLYCIEADNSSIIPVSPGSVVLIQNELADYRHLKGIVDIDKIKIEDLMIAHSVLWTGEPHSLNYINSIYGSLNRVKHLSYDDPTFYSAADSVEPMRMWKSYFIPEFKRDRQSWEVYKRYRLPLARIIDKAQETGVRIDSSRLDEVRDLLIQHIESYKEKAREITGNSKFQLGGTKDMRDILYG
jgi:uracil-DNA glycosylase